jgi:hypothetical protein
MRLIRILLLAAAASSAFGQSPADFQAGANYPWLNYGGDFGANAWGHRGISAPESRGQIAADFSFLRSKKVRIVRWFLFCDGRAGLQYDGRGYVTGIDEHVYPDLDAALAVARENGIQLILVLFDFHLLDAPQWTAGVQLGGRANLVVDSRARDSLFVNALQPLLARYGRRPEVYAWEIMNEPESRASGIVGTDALQDFAGRLASAIHAGGGRATLGSAKLRDLSLWRDVGLDVYQYHDYEDVYRSAHAEVLGLTARAGLDKRCLLGEFPTKNSRVGLEGYMDAARHEGLTGALAWSLRAQDDYSDFRSVADRFAAWAGGR